MITIIAEKPSVAQSIAAVVGSQKKRGWIYIR
jgi:DNA topoisomerase IA